MKEEASLNILLKPVTLSTTQSLSGWLNAEASPNMLNIVVTALVIHEPMFRLNAEA